MNWAASAHTHAHAHAHAPSSVSVAFVTGVPWAPATIHGSRCRLNVWNKRPRHGHGYRHSHNQSRRRSILIRDDEDEDEMDTFPSYSTTPSTYSTSTTKCTYSSTPSDDEALSNKLAKLRSLRDSLDSALASEDYLTAAGLRDAISEMETQANETQSDLSVILTNDAFYAAYRAADVDAMAGVWLHSDSASCTHPLSGIVTGFEHVVQSWRNVFSVSGKPASIDTEVLSVEICRNLAWVVCKQMITNVRGREIIGGERIATNLFQKSNGKWLIVHHHASPVVVEDANERT